MCNTLRYTFLHLVFTELYDRLYTVVGLFKVLKPFKANESYCQCKDEDFNREENDLVVDHGFKDVLERLMEPDLGGVDESIIRGDVHVEVSEMFSCAVGRQLIERFHGRCHVVNQVDLIVSNSLIEIVGLKGLI